jgi:hypothetical protein
MARGKCRQLPGKTETQPLQHPVAVFFPANDAGQERQQQHADQERQHSIEKHHRFCYSLVKGHGTNGCPFDTNILSLCRRRSVCCLENLRTTHDSILSNDQTDEYIDFWRPLYIENSFLFVFGWILFLNGVLGCGRVLSQIIHSLPCQSSERALGILEVYEFK